MHKSSLNNMEKFFDEYLKNNNKILVVGSKKYHGHMTYKDIVSEEKDVQYFGVDISEGENVDIIIKDIYAWEAIGDEEYDIVISGQTFEHMEFFWVAFKEMARVLKKGGHICVIAPSSGKIHRYPVDCWRFFPDGMRSLAKYANIKLLESYIDNSSEWKDCIGIFTKE